MMRFLTVGSCPLRAASSFKSRTGLESLDEVIGKFVSIFVDVSVIEIDVGKDPPPLATTTSVFGILINVGMLRRVFGLEFELFPEPSCSPVTIECIGAVTDIGVGFTSFSHSLVVKGFFIVAGDETSADAPKW